MAEKLLYNGENIIASVNIVAATLDQYVGSERSDTIELTFGQDDAWADWHPQDDDKIRYTKDGADSGIMYLYDMSIESGLTTLYACSTPSSMRIKNSKAWEQIYLNQIGTEIAGRSGMSFKLVGISDQFYGYMKQEKETDTAFLSRLASLEGCALMIFNNEIIMAKESELEAAAATVSISTDGTYLESFDHSARAYGSAVVEVGQYKGVASHGSGRQYVADSRRIIATSNAECMRYASGELRRVNKNLTGIKVTALLHPDLAAGITCKLTDTVPAGWSGTLFAHHVRQEFHKQRTTIFLRKPLEGY